MRIVFQFLLLSFLLSGQSVTYEYELESKNDTLLILNSIDGNITIRGTDQKNIRIVQQIKSNLDFQALNKGNLRSNNSIIEFYEQPGISLTINKIYDIFIPQHMDVNLDLLGGSLEVVHINGSLSVTKLSGLINVNDISGNTHLTTGDGNLKIENVQGDIYGSVLNGNIFSSNTRGYLRLESGSGDLSIIEHDGSLEMKTFAGNCLIQNVSGDTIQALTRGGDISVHSLSTTEGRFNTMAGDIVLENVDGNTFSETYGGFITGSNWTGDFELQNYSGSITVSDVQGNLTINSFYGNVEINRYFPNDSIGNSSVIKIVSGSLFMSYVGDSIGLDLKTQGGSISSNVAKIIGEYPHMGIYHPANEMHKINVTLFNGNIVINRGNVND